MSLYNTNGMFCFPNLFGTGRNRMNCGQSNIPDLRQTEMTGSSGPREPVQTNPPTAPESCNGCGNTGPPCKMGPPEKTGPPGRMGPPGDMGPMGPRGAQGPAGCKGDRGEMGPQGVTGAQGKHGVTGPMEPLGEAGCRGPMGPPGCSPDSVFAEFADQFTMLEPKTNLPLTAVINDNTGHITFNKDYSVILKPGFYGIYYYLSAMLKTAGYVKIIPVYNSSIQSCFSGKTVSKNGNDSLVISRYFLAEIPEKCPFCLAWRCKGSVCQINMNLIIHKLNR